MIDNSATVASLMAQMQGHLPIPAFPSKEMQTERESSDSAHAASSTADPAAPPGGRPSSYDCV
jgi:hypothetical protein